jgi:uncharacterized coiled-coil protein SlyX
MTSSGGRPSFSPGRTSRSDEDDPLPGGVEPFVPPPCSNPETDAFVEFFEERCAKNEMQQAAMDRLVTQLVAGSASTAEKEVARLRAELDWLREHLQFVIEKHNKECAAVCERLKKSASLIASMTERMDTD